MNEEWADPLTIPSLIADVRWPFPSLPDGVLQSWRRGIWTLRSHIFTWASPESPDFRPPRARPA